MTTPLLLRGVDIAAFAVALVQRLHRNSVAVSPSGPTAFVDVLRRQWPRTRTQLYWHARLTLVNRVEDLAAFDAVFEAVFADAVLGVDPPGLKRSLGTTAAADAGVPGRENPVAEGNLPWSTLPASVTASDTHETEVGIPDTLPSRFVARVDEPFDRFDAADLRQLGDWLERAANSWPQRRSLRREPHQHGKRIDMRETLKASRTTGWEPMRLARTRARRHPRRIVMACDVSQSMRQYATVYLHLMRAAALRQKGIRPEVFAFSTSLTRLTAALANRSAEVALAKANAKVTDRYGGTHLGRCVADLVGGSHGNALRGAVVIIASDGWDSDPPEILEHALARVRRRAHKLVWLNPRAAQPEFRPLAASMAAALPYCDLLLPAHSVTGLRELFTALTD
ncbi:VWA domain-containing protein [Mycobacterium sp. 3519A]|uniref:vWA domain-containing protein n=1 Tax=Mycobacterium sp. 3519A TaxID=2057184 RepID=UPI000C7DB339|nr:VWA domain-containing protein [Mycobacterium sp. 3519A]